MGKPKLSWEAIEASGSLILKVAKGDRNICWRVGKGTRDLSGIFYEIADELEPSMAEPRPKLFKVTQKPEQIPEVHGDQQMSEEGSAELRAAKARAVEKKAGKWFSNMDDDDEELPFIQIGHGDERNAS